eukprot:jgi/Pico_ML_1/54371/g4730.t1
MERRTNGVDNTSRRTWDKDQYASMAQEREAKERAFSDDKKRRRMELDPLHNGLIRERARLTHRDQEVVLDQRLGQAQVFSASGPRHQQPGYYCNVCECVLKDSKSYVDHINGKKHLKLLGMSTRVERETIGSAQGEEDWEERARRSEDREKEEKRLKQARKRLRKERASATESQEDACDVDPDLAATMGFQGFNTSKK